ncbi:Ubiquitin-conjugating enzyme E2 1 [Sporothrix eucalyptigena]|uniref:Ubiquitin-conjugating enzyme E2 2 n=1 Tax=Sporothrix eucalyptigena TaxID=1812306 RepID=A0ABP0CNL2_9PEZI
MSRARRVAKELSDIARDSSTTDISVVALDPANLTTLQGTFGGPPDTPYAGGTYIVNITIPDNYPFKPPAMKLATKIWHPNISSQTGAICLDTLSTGWSPVNTIKTTLLSLRMLLESPNPSDPQDAQVATMLTENPGLFKVVAHDWAVRYAGAPRKMPLPSEYKGTEGKAEIRPDDPARYRGYNKNLVTRFTDMGFSVENVVNAFIRVGIERNDGRDYPLEEAYIGDVTAYLFDEP